MDADTGKVLWQHKMAPDQLHASPLYADGKLYVPFQNGSFFIVRPTLVEPDFGPVQLAGNGANLTYSFDVTYRFVWVADPEAEGEDDPVTEVRNLAYTATLGWADNSGFEDTAAGCSGAWALQVTSVGGTSSAAWTATMTSTPNYPDAPTITVDGTWGEVSGFLPYTLSGMEAEVRVNFQGSLTTTGPQWARCR